MVAVTSARRQHRFPSRARHLSLVAPGTFRVELGTPGDPFSTQDVRGAVRPVSAATYRRRRLAVLFVAAGLAFVAWLALGALGGVLTAPVRSAPPPPQGAKVVEVGPGDTLWSIARRLQPKGDPRPLVDRLAARNGGTVVQVGDRLAVG